MSWRTKFRALFRKDKLDAEMSEELRAHLELQTAENVQRGLSPDEARYAAQRGFGGVEQIKEHARDQRGWIWLEQGLRDGRYAVRQLAKSPGFTAVAVLSLALGIGASSAIFSLVDAVLLKSLPVKNPEELVLLSWRATPIPVARQREIGFMNGLRGGWTDPDGQSASYAFSLLAFDQFREHSQSLADVFGFFADAEFNVMVDGQVEISHTGQYVTGNYHSALGVPAILGRTLTPDDDRAGAPPVAVISHGFWQRRFGGAATAVGRTITVNKTPFTVVGVTPADFAGTLEVGEAPDFSLPLAQYPETQQMDRARNLWSVRLMGRLKPGVIRAAAQAELSGLFRRAVDEGVATMRRWMPQAPDEIYLPRLRVEPGGQGLNRMRPFYARSLALLIGLVGLVLLLACANVANLLLARGTARRREIAVRLALGAGRGRIVRQLLTESLLLSACGGGLGVLFAAWGKDALVAMHPLGWGASTTIHPQLDPRVVGFTLCVALGTCVLAGLFPALQATRLDLVGEFQGGARTTGSRGTLRLRRGLMVLQVALSVILLVAAVLFARTLRELRRVDLGFNREHLLLFRIDATPAGYSRAEFAAVPRRFTESIEALPGVRGVTLSTFAIFDGWNTRTVWRPGQPRPGPDDWVTLNVVGTGYFATLGLPVLRGRSFGPQDDDRASGVVIISQSLARKYFGTEDPIGARFSVDATRPEPKFEVVGVVADMRWVELRDAPRPTLYFPFAFNHLQAFSDKWAQMNFTVRCAGDPDVVAAAVRRAVRTVDPTLPVTDLRMLDEQIERTFAREQLLARLSSFFGVVALVLACVGLYGLTTYVVLSRTGEIGLRMALGALPRNILRMILRESLLLVAFGAVLGIGAAWVGTRWIAAMLYGFSPTDPLTYGAVGVLLAAVAMLACWLPARRAAKVDPMVALRCE